MKFTWAALSTLAAGSLNRRLSGSNTPEWTKGGDICVIGMLEENSAPWMAYCNCGSGGTKCEEHGIFTTIVALAGGENCKSEEFDAATCHLTPAASNSAYYNIGTRRFWMEKDIDDEDSGATYAMMTDGISQWLDDDGNSFYFGTAYYLVQTGELSYNKNLFIAPHESKIGESYLFETCVVPPSGTPSEFTTCGDKVQAAAGTMKFAIYGGPNNPGKDAGYGAGVGGGWVRTLYCHKGLGEPKVQLEASDEWLKVSEVVESATKRKKQVSGLWFGSAADKNVIRMEFTQLYTYGRSSCAQSTYEDWGNGLHYIECPPHKSMKINIRVAKLTDSDMCDDSEGFFLDYYVAGIGHQEFFVYDPTVATDEPPATNSDNANDTSDATIGGLAAATVAAGAITTFLV